MMRSLSEFVRVTVPVIRSAGAPAAAKLILRRRPVSVPPHRSILSAGARVVRRPSPCSRVWSLLWARARSWSKQIPRWSTESADATEPGDTDAGHRECRGAEPFHLGIRHEVARVIRAPADQPGVSSQCIESVHRVSASPRSATSVVTTDCQPPCAVCFSGAAAAIRFPSRVVEKSVSLLRRTRGTKQYLEPLVSFRWTISAGDGYR